MTLEIGKIKSILFLFVLSSISVNQAFGQITAEGTCSGVGTNATYRVLVAGLDSLEVYNIMVGGASQAVSLTDSVVLTALQNFVDGTDTIVVRVMSTISPDTTDIIVHEIYCADIDNDGSLDYNKASCDYTVALPNSGVIVSTVAPYNGTNVYLYILSDTAGVVANPIVSNYSGYFNNLVDGQYRVSAYNFLSTSDADDFLAGLTPGSSDIDSYNSSSDPCYSFCGKATYTVTCDCIISIDTEPVDYTVCEEGDAVFFVASSLTGSLVPPGSSLEYQWQVDTTGVGNAFNDYADTDSVLNLNYVTLSMDGNLYRVIITFDVASTDICRDTSSAAILNVDPEPIMASNLDATVCSDEASGIILRLASGSVAADSFNIISITSNGLTSSAGSPSVGITADTSILADDAWTNITASNVDVIYEVAPISSEGCIGDTIQITLTVTPEPVYAGGDITTVCSDDISGITIPTTDDNSNPMDSFVVSALVGSNLTGTATTGATVDSNFLANDQFNNVSGVLDSVVYTLIPFNGSCEGSSFTLILKVKPEPLFTGNLDVSICSDVVSNVVLPSVDDSSLAIDSFSITAVVGDSLIGTATTGTGITSINAIASDIFNNVSFAVDSVVYTITPYSMGCVGSSFAITVIVNPEPVGQDPLTLVCSDEALSISLAGLIINGMVVDSFRWAADANANVTGETTSVSTATSITDVLTNVTASNQVVTYRVVPISDELCVGDTFTVTVTVQPEPTAEPLVLTVCSDETLNVDLGDQITNGVGIQGYNYTVSSSNQDSVPAATARTDTSNANITDTYTNTTASAVTITYTVTPISTANCVGDTFTVTVTVDPEPVMSSALSATVCSNTATGVVLSVAVGSVAADSFRVVSINSNGLISTGGSPAVVTTANDSIIADDVWENTSASAVDVIYSVLAISDMGCYGDTMNITVTIDPEVLVEAGTPLTICSNGVLTLADLGATITGGTTSGTWTTSGTGSFNNGGVFGSATSYTPSEADKDAKQVTLTLTSADPAGPCPSVLDTVVITIDDVRCSQFPWNGN